MAIWNLKMFAKFHSHLRGGIQITRVLGFPGGYPGIPKTRHGDTHFTRDLGMAISKNMGIQGDRLLGIPKSL